MCEFSVVGCIPQKLEGTRTSIFLMYRKAEATVANLIQMEIK